MYGFPRLNEINQVRKAQLEKMVLLKKKSKVDLTNLAPCRNDFQPHVERVYHRVAHFKRAHQAYFEAPKAYEENQVS